jgi:hypothetical protein
LQVREIKIQENKKQERERYLVAFLYLEGASNGGMLAMGMAVGLTPMTCRALLEGPGVEVFANPASKLHNVTHPKFDVSTLNQFIKTNYVSGTKLMALAFVALMMIRTSILRCSATVSGNSRL